MNRRALLARFAAIAAVATVAPAAKPGAGVAMPAPGFVNCPHTSIRCACDSTPPPWEFIEVVDMGLYKHGDTWRMAIDGLDVGSVQPLIDQERADARAEGFNHGHAVATARAESRARHEQGG